MSDINAKELAERFLSILDKKYKRTDLSKYDYILYADNDSDRSWMAETLQELGGVLKDMGSGTFEYLNLLRANDLIHEIPEYSRMVEENSPLIHDVEDIIAEVLYYDSTSIMANDLGDFDDDKFEDESYIYIGFKKNE